MFVSKQPSHDVSKHSVPVAATLLLVAVGACAAPNTDTPPDMNITPAGVVFTGEDASISLPPDKPHTGNGFQPISEMREAWVDNALQARSPILRTYGWAGPASGDIRVSSAGFKQFCFRKIPRSGLIERPVKQHEFIVVMTVLENPSKPTEGCTEVRGSPSRGGWNYRHQSVVSFDPPWSIQQASTYLLDQFQPCPEERLGHARHQLVDGRQLLLFACQKDATSADVYSISTMYLWPSTSDGVMAHLDILPEQAVYTIDRATWNNLGRRAAAVSVFAPNLARRRQAGLHAPITSVVAVR